MQDILQPIADDRQHLVQHCHNNRILIPRRSPELDLLLLYATHSWQNESQCGDSAPFEK